MRHRCPTVRDGIINHFMTDSYIFFGTAGQLRDLLSRKEGADLVRPKAAIQQGFEGKPFSGRLWDRNVAICLINVP
jgi:hypothetical protein